ncbi:MAG: hypothetical protein LBK95_14500 [Bifidobacteriaceae bacterium]|jgi:hypothetical protein|nr:hypothetical protein [Bifidobacteriaceae bacterium]
MTHVWLTELRRSVFRFAAPLLAVAYLALMLSRLQAWRGVWPAASAQIGAHWIFIGPIVAGLAAWETARRRGHLETSSRQETRCLFAPLLAAQLAWTGLIVLVAAVCAAVASWATDAPSGFLWPSYLVLTAALAVECVAVGHLLGRICRPDWFGPVLAVLLIFLRIVMFSSAATGSYRSAFARIVLGGQPHVGLNSWAVACAAVEAGLLVAAALVVPPLIDRIRTAKSGRVLALGRPGMVTSVVGAIVFAVGVAAVFTSPSVHEERTPPDELLCTDTGIRLCIWPEHEVYLPALTIVAEEADNVALELGEEASGQLNEFGLDWTTGNFSLINSSTWFLSDALADVIVDSLAPLPCVPAEHDQAYEPYVDAFWHASAMVRLMLEDAPPPTGTGDTTGVDQAALVREWEAGPAAQHAWVERYTGEMREAAARMACE